MGLVSDILSQKFRMIYKKAQIYFASGTGNSYRVAAWMHEACAGRNIQSKIIPIDSAKPKEEIEPSSENLVVLAYPTHGLLPPWSMIKFIFKMPFKRGTHAFCMPTRGALYIGRLFIPGIAGLASILPAVVLPFKGYNFRGSLSFDMPANLTAVHNRLRDWSISRIISNSKRKGSKYIERLLSGKTVFFTWNNLWEYFWGILFLYYFPLFPIAYLLLGKFFVGRMLFANNDCIGCGLCAKSCPNNAIIMKGKEKPRPYWKYNCEACYRCLNYCQQKAVEAGIAWAVLLYFIWALGIPVGYYFLKYVSIYYPEISRFNNWWTIQLIDAIYVYPAYSLAYYIFYNLLRIRWINNLFTYTSFSRYWRRYHEPETSINDLT